MLCTDIEAGKPPKCSVPDPEANGVITVEIQLSLNMAHLFPRYFR